MLPDGPAAGMLDSGRYGAFAMDQLIGQLVQRGAQRTTMEAKLFGGAAVVGAMSSIQIGERNTRFVLDYLRTEHIPVVSQDVLDVYPRKVCFLPHSGRAMVKRLQPTQADAVLDQERLARQQAAAPAGGAGGSVDLF
jgi:chemotaxis protein CheD